MQQVAFIPPMGVLEFLCEASANGGAYPEKKEGDKYSIQ